MPSQMTLLPQDSTEFADRCIALLRHVLDENNPLTSERLTEMIQREPERYKRFKRIVKYLPKRKG